MKKKQKRLKWLLGATAVDRISAVAGLALFFVFSLILLML